MIQKFKFRLPCPLYRIIIYNYNVSFIYLAYKSTQHQGTSHVEIYLYFVKEPFAIKHLQVLHARSTYQFSYIFTKGLPS